MLTIAPPYYQIRGVTIFRDHEDPTVFYYLPLRTYLKTRDDGGPSLTLYKYRRDLTDNPTLLPMQAAGGGLALFEVEARADHLALVEMELQSEVEVDDLRLVPAPFRSGEVRAIVAKATGDSFAEQLVQSRAAALVAPHSAAFALGFEPEGATLFEQAMLGGMLPVGVTYDLRFLALTPALHARVTMDYERIYDHFSTSVGFTYYVSVKLDADLAWLVENDAITIEITAFTDEEDRKRQEALVMALVKARVQGDFFRSGVPAAPQEGAAGPLGELLGSLTGGGEITSASAFFVLKAKFEAVRERKHFVLEFDSRTAVELTHVCSGLLGSMLGEDSDVIVANHIHALDLDDPFFSSLEVRVGSVVDFAQMPDLKEAHAHLKLGDHRQSFSFMPAPVTGEGDIEPAAEPLQVFRSPLTDPSHDEYELTVELHFDPELGRGPRLIEAGPFSSRDRVWVLDPLQYMQYRRVRLMRGPVDSETVPRIHAVVWTVAEDGSTVLAPETVVLTDETPEVTWRARLEPNAPPQRVRIRADWEDTGGVVHRGREAQVEGDSYVLMGPFEAVMTVSIHAATDWTRVTQVLMEVRYVTDDQRFERRHVFTESAADPVVEEFPLLDADLRSYEWRQVVFFIDGSKAETEWATTDHGVLVVGATAASHEVRVVWVGDVGDALGIRVDIHVVDGGTTETASAFLRAGESEAVVVLPLPGDAPLSYRYEASKVTSAGAQPIRSGQDTSTILVVQT